MQTSELFTQYWRNKVFLVINAVHERHIHSSAKNKKIRNIYLATDLALSTGVEFGTHAISLVFIFDHYTGYGSMNTCHDRPILVTSWFLMFDAVYKAMCNSDMKINRASVKVIKNLF